MGSSRSFASTADDNVALFRLGFPGASVRKTLTRPPTVTRRIIMQKARRHTLNRAPTACKRMVSGSVSSPSRGSSHLSVALLSSLSVVREYLALRDGPRRFSRDSTWPDLLRNLPGAGQLSRTGLSPSVVDLSMCIPLTNQFLTPMWKALQPRAGRPARFGLFRVRSPLLTESRFSFFSTGYLDVSVHRVGPACL